ncbi:MAG: Gx transporter family protein [Oscillospiraceae bacterium]|nr:Gx transporter family protein [Oscillospiraceae bacterium]
MRKPLKKTITLALLTAVSLILFTVEMQFPPLTPFPWIKIGLANTITLFILYRRGFTALDAFLVVIARVLLAALITGSPTALLFSFCGGIAAVTAMLAFIKTVSGKKPPPAITSVAGALAHNITQIAIAVFVYGGFGVLMYLPALIIGGIMSGVITGLVTTVVLKRL